MLEATMEDLSDQMANLDEKMNLLAEASEAIPEQMEEIVDIMNGEINPDTVQSPEMSRINPLPFYPGSLPCKSPLHVRVQRAL